MWRDLVARVNAGVGHEEEAKVQPGGLAIFCPACPQPGINLPKNWNQDPKRCVACMALDIFHNSYLSGGYIPGALLLMATSLQSI